MTFSVFSLVIYAIVDMWATKTDLVFLIFMTVLLSGAEMILAIIVFICAMAAWSKG
jgi:hypothetical protein